MGTSIVGSLILISSVLSAQSLDTPDPTTIRHNTIGPVPKILPSVVRGYDVRDRFVLGQRGIFQLDTNGNPAMAINHSSNVATRTDSGYSNGDNNYWPLTVVDIVETDAGDLWRLTRVFSIPRVARNHSRDS